MSAETGSSELRDVVAWYVRGAAGAGGASRTGRPDTATPGRCERCADGRIAFGDGLIEGVFRGAALDGWARPGVRGADDEDGVGSGGAEHPSPGGGATYTVVATPAAVTVAAVAP